MKQLIKSQFHTQIVTINSKLLSPVKSQSVYNHSPDGFAWGYGGSGPAQLALAILLEYTNKKIAIDLYQDFKKEVIANIPRDDFELEIDIKKWIKEKGGQNV